MLVDMLQVITELLLPSQADLHLNRVIADDLTQTLFVEVTSTQVAPACPRCSTTASRVHSHYTRTLADLPWADVAIQVRLHVRKCFCPTESCSRTIFCERVPQIARP
jgi:transposase